MNGTVGTSAAIAAMLTEAADRIERRHAETTAENRGESACTTLADNIKDVDELALQYREASQDARDHHRIWIAEPDKQSPLYPTRPHEPDTPQVVIHPDGISALHPGDRRRAANRRHANPGLHRELPARASVPDILANRRRTATDRV